MLPKFNFVQHPDTLMEIVMTKDGNAQLCHHHFMDERLEVTLQAAVRGSRRAEETLQMHKNNI